MITKIIGALASLITVISIICAIIFLAPVDPARLSFGQRADSETVEAYKKHLGIDQSFIHQLGSYLHDLSPLSYYSNEKIQNLDISGFKLFSNDDHALLLKKPYLRVSFQTGGRVANMIKRVLPNTIVLALVSIIFASIIGIFLGFLAAQNRDKWLDNFIIVISTLGYSIPSFVSAIFFSVIFGFYLRDIFNLPMQGSVFTLDNFGNDVINLKNVILPAIALGIRPLAIITQLSRNSFLDIKHEKYIFTARAKGLSNGHIVSRHIFKNALNPIITGISGWFASLLAGAFFVEKIFNYDGLGLLTVDALTNYDIPVIVGCIVCVASLFIIMNMAIDYVYKILDPRIT